MAIATIRSRCVTGQQLAEAKQVFMPITAWLSCKLSPSCKFDFADESLLATGRPRSIQECWGLSALASTVRQRAPQCPRHLCVGLFGRSDGINLGRFRRM